MTMTTHSFALPLKPADRLGAGPQKLRRNGAQHGNSSRSRFGQDAVRGNSISGQGRSTPFVSQRPEGEGPSIGSSPILSDWMMPGAIMMSWLAAMLGIGIFAYGIGFGRSAFAMAGLLCLTPATTGALLATAMIRQFKRPCAVLARAADRLASGEQGVRVENGDAGIELADLIDGFNAMAEAIDSQEKERLLLIAGITHELRTPLTILQGRLHGIEDGVIEPEAGETERLLRQVRHILHIVDDLDTLVNADAGRLCLTRKRLDLNAICRPAVDDVQALTERHGVRFVQDYQPVTLVGDPVRITQILTNLLTNAAKHSPSDGEIMVRVRAVGGRAVIDVMDQGPGLAAADRDHLFTPYWRSSASRRSGCPGSGMGLALTARLVHAHGGHIVGENRRDRSGARFSVSLPLGLAA